MSKVIVVMAIVLIAFAGICAITALATFHWMKACLPVCDLIIALQAQYRDNSGVITYLNQPSVEKLDSSDLCYDLGLFQLSFRYTNVKGLNYNTHLESRAANAFFQITAVMLIACVILFAVAVLFLSLNWCINESLIQLNSRATYYANLGVGILAVATIMYGSGMVYYSVLQSKVVDDPRLFFGEIGSTIQKGLKEMYQGLDGNYNPLDKSFHPDVWQPYRGRRRRQVEGSYYRRYPYNGLPKPHHTKLSKEVSEMLKKVHVTFEYSFFVGWIGFIFAVFATILGLCRNYRTPDQNADAVLLEPVYEK